jgi:hypothetical protein
MKLARNHHGIVSATQNRTCKHADVVDVQILESSRVYFLEDQGLWCLFPMVCPVRNRHASCDVTRRLHVNTAFGTQKDLRANQGHDCSGIVHCNPSNFPLAQQINVVLRDGVDERADLTATVSNTKSGDTNVFQQQGTRITSQGDQPYRKGSDNSMNRVTFKPAITTSATALNMSLAASGSL